MDVYLVFVEDMLHYQPVSFVNGTDAFIILQCVLLVPQIINLTDVCNTDKGKYCKFLCAAVYSPQEWSRRWSMEHNVVFHLLSFQE